MATILVTGATGMLGASLVPALAAHGHRVIAHGFRAAPEGGVQGDLRDAAATAALLDAAAPEVIIHLAALTNVDACEEDPHAAYQLNVLPVENLAHWLRGRPASHLVHISTDQVYDGAGPHAEPSVTIRNTYALSKIASELAAASVQATILRTNFFGPSRCAGRASFSDWLLQALRGGKEIPVFEDVLFSPVSIDTLCAMIERVALARPPGVFNLGSREGMSKADFAFALAHAFGLSDAGLRRTRAADAGVLKARRPTDMRLDSSRFERTLGLRLPALIDEIHSLRSADREPA
jgi:dTDP-4-dehydrorhamnose reductase